MNWARMKNRKTRTLKTVISALSIGVCLAFGQGEDEETHSTPEVPDILDLDTVLRYALENNFSIRRAVELIEEQEGLIVEVKARALPNLSLNSNYDQLDEGLSDTGGGVFNPNTENWGVSLNTRQALYEGGGVRSAIRAQDLLRESAKLFLESTIMDAALEVKTRYFAVLLAREQIKVEEQNIELLEETLVDARNRLEAGTVSDFEVLRAEVLLANAQPALIRRRSGFSVAIEQLRQSMGYRNYRRDTSNLTKVPEFIGSIDYEPVEFDLVESLNVALSDRSEIERLRVIEEARNAGVKIAMADYRPTIDLIGSYGKRKSSFSDSFDDGPEGWMVGVEASWDVFDGLRRKGRMRQARSQLEQARIDSEALRLQIEVEVRQAIAEFREAQQLVQAAAKAVEQGEEALRLADSRYAAGAISQLDVLESRFALTQSRTNRLEADYRHMIAVENLRRARGEGKPVIEE